MLTFPNIDPIAFHLGPAEIRWYGIAYVAGIVLAWLYCRHLVKRAPNGLTVDNIDDFVVWATIGVVAGGRFGDVLFYLPDEFIQRPWEIFYLWKPGMSFHGGLLGVTIATIIFCRKYRIPILSLADMIACAAPIGLCFGRIANFINSELWGRVSDVSWAMVFPNGGPLPRHPSQLYEAALEGLALFLLLALLEHTTQLRSRCRGLFFSIFLIGYGAARIFVECYRVPDGMVMGITTGQFLSLPLVIVGLALMVYSCRRK